MNRPGSIRVESHQLSFQGLQIAMRVSGVGPPLLLINGMTRPMQSWEHITRELTGRTVITFDAPGVGDSPNALFPLTIAGHAALAAAVLDAAGVAEADVLGYSHGGAVAQQLACDAPERVRRLVLVATSCGVGATPSRGRAIRSGVGALADESPWHFDDALGLLWQSWAISSWSSISFLSSITAATLVVCGTRDSVVPPANSQVLARRIPNASLVLLPAGHDLQLAEHAKALARTVENFLQTTRQPTNEEGQDHGLSAF